MNKKIQNNTAPESSELRLGFVPLTDCAPVVMALELGLYARHGLKVRLSRELGWATVRDKMVYGELEASHALAAMPLTATLGLGSIAVDCCTALVMSLHGNAITLSKDLWDRKVRDGESLREHIRSSRRNGLLTFGAVFPFSSHRQLLRKWLGQHGIDPERDVRIVTVPPPQLAANLKAGNLDGFCSGEPWNSVAVEAGAGWIAATSGELDSHHPEKVLMVRNEFAIRREPELLALVRALVEACAFCQNPANHRAVAEVLSRPGYIGVDADTLVRGLGGRLDTGPAGFRNFPGFIMFHGPKANEPSPEKAAWLFDLVRSSGISLDPAMMSFELCRRVYRADLFNKALHSTSALPLAGGVEEATPGPNSRKASPVLSNA